MPDIAAIWFAYAGALRKLERFDDAVVDVGDAVGERGVVERLGDGPVRARAVGVT